MLSSGLGSFAYGKFSAPFLVHILVQSHDACFRAPVLNVSQNSTSRSNAHFRLLCLMLTSEPKDFNQGYFRPLKVFVCILRQSALEREAKAIPAQKGGKIIDIFLGDPYYVNKSRKSIWYAYRPSTRKKGQNSNEL